MELGYIIQPHGILTSSLKFSDKAIMCDIFTFYYRNNKVYCKSNNELSNEFGCSKNTIIRSIGNLKHKGWIKTNKIRMPVTNIIMRSIPAINVKKIFGEQINNSDFFKVNNKLSLKSWINDNFNFKEGSL